MSEGVHDRSQVHLSCALIACMMRKANGQLRVLTAAACALFLIACPRKHEPSPRPAPSPPQLAEGAEPPSSHKAPPSQDLESSACLRDLPAADPTGVPFGDGADASGKLGVVTSVDASATKVGVRILEAGGNAVDAAVGVAFALAVTHPSAGNIGGGGFMTLKMGSAVETIDFREDSPKKLTDKVFWKMIRAGGRGPLSVGVPGTVAGLFLAHQRHGRLPFKEVVRPAAELAESGYPLGDRQAKTIVWAEQDLRRDEVAKALFFPGGNPARPGAVMKNPGLATALQRIMEHGPDGFYKGPTADDLVASLGPEGLLTLEDLASYKAIVRQPLCFDFQGFRVVTFPAPSAGGVAVAQTLLMLSKSGIEKTLGDKNEPPNPILDTAPGLHLFAEASRRAQAERQLFVAAPEALSDEERRAQNERWKNPQLWLTAHPISPDRATPSSDIDPSFAKLLAELEHTTHLSVIDKEGGLVSLTVTLSGSYGARIFSKKTGIAFNNSTASFSSVGVNTPKGGYRTTSSMAPTLALYGEGAAFVLGSPGGDTIPSTVSQLLLRLALHKQSLKEAVEAPRVHQTFAPGALTTEKGRPLPEALKLGLTKLGHQINERSSTIGDANTAVWLFDTAYAVCDSREGGAALAASR